MYKYSKRSLSNLRGCDIRLQQIFVEVIKHQDCTILEGHRDKKKQTEVFNKGLSKLKFPHSKHNSYPSKAVDVVPYPIDWNNHKRFILFAGFVMGIAASLGIKIRWGGDWNRNKDPNDERFIDYPHFELDED
jgi:peptidoglycan LD-endopeptidase CwlK